MSIQPNLNPASNTTSDLILENIAVSLSLPYLIGYDCLTIHQMTFAQMREVFQTKPEDFVKLKQGLKHAMRVPYLLPSYLRELETKPVAAVVTQPSPARENPEVGQAILQSLSEELGMPQLVTSGVSFELVDTWEYDDLNGICPMTPDEYAKLKRAIR